MTQKNLNDRARKATGGDERQRIRAVSLIAPWGWAIVHGPKWIENRVWWSDMQGPLVLHASKAPSPARFAAEREKLLRIMQALGLELDVPKRDDMAHGAVIGRARVFDTILPGGYRSDHKLLRSQARTFYKLHGASWGDDLRKGGARVARHELAGVPWHFVGEYGYALTERRALIEPLPWNGHQKGWSIPPELEQELATRALGPARLGGIATA